ncbi:restriction endonuclease subunit S [Vibrio sp. 10N.286.48.F5]|uniref:restriction endonuclease subunit S n=1 Tax=Vibrio sp. 10N.286.48.F5 TaxID=3229699 RepID=UPI00354F00B9
MSELPKGWATSKLPELISCDGVISDGDWIESKDQDPDGNIRLIQLADIGDGKFINKSSRFMNEERASLLRCTFLEEGDVLIARMPDPLGRACIFPNIDSKAVTVVDICLIRVGSKAGVTNHLLKYWFNTPIIRSQIAMLATGTTRKRITRKKLADLQLPVPPYNEQIRIANKLDSILAKVDKAQARLDKIPAILKRFRQSVLAAATSGELTKEWREVEGISKDTWQPVTIDDLSNRAFDGPFGSKLKTADYTDHGIKVARLENIGHLVFNSAKETFISEVKYQDLIKNTIEHNDVLFSSFVDEEIRTCLFDERFGTYINKADCFCIRPNQDLISPEFLMYSLACKHTYEKIKKQVHGATRPRVNLRFLKSFEISLPSPEEQIVVVDKINQLFSKASKVEKQYLDAKARLDRLPQSILAKAFRGELVPQDPNDEPAEKLLERIVAEKEQSKPKKTTRKRTIKAKTAEKE